MVEIPKIAKKLVKIWLQYPPNSFLLPLKNWLEPPKFLSGELVLSCAVSSIKICGFLKSSSVVFTSDLGAWLTSWLTSFLWVLCTAVCLLPPKNTWVKQQRAVNKAKNKNFLCAPCICKLLFVLVKNTWFWALLPVFITVTNIMPIFHTFAHWSAEHIANLTI